MKIITRNRVAKAMQVTALCLCTALAFRGHPPAGAQLVPALTMKDAQQDQLISNLHESAERADAALKEEVEQSLLARQRETDRLNQLAEDVSGLKGENRVEFGGIALLGGGGMLLRRDRKHKRDLE